MEIVKTVSGTISNKSMSAVMFAIIRSNAKLTSTLTASRESERKMQSGNWVEYLIRFKSKEHFILFENSLGDHKNMFSITEGPQYVLN